MCLAVGDAGKGVSVEVHSRLFGPFVTIKERGKGTGLGLASVFGVVKQNLGLISVHTEPGQRTTFEIHRCGKA